MTVTSTRDYRGVPADALANFHGNQLVYAAWDHHLMFAAPFITCVSPAMRFGEYADEVLAKLVAADPDAPRIDWHAVKWVKGGKVFRPDFDRSLADNGIRHKEQLRFRTPGLNTLGEEG